METVDEMPQIDIDAMCRMCHKHFGDKSVDIFDDESATTLPISVQMKMFAGIQVTPLDTMPTKLCLGCRIDLEKANLMRTKCENREAKMRKHVRTVNAGRVSHVFDDATDTEEGEEYIESAKIIDELSQQLGAPNRNAQHVDFELKKQQILDEARAVFEEELKLAKTHAQHELMEAKRGYEEEIGKASRANEIESLVARANIETAMDELQSAQAELERITVLFEENEKRLREAEKNLAAMQKEVEKEREYIATLTAAHEAEIGRIHEKAQQDLKSLVDTENANAPPSKRKQASALFEPNSMAAPSEARNDGAAMAESQESDGSMEKTENGFPCHACGKAVSDEAGGKFVSESFNFCSECCMRKKDPSAELDGSMGAKSNGSATGDSRSEFPKHRSSADEPMPTTSTSVGETASPKLPPELVSISSAMGSDVVSSYRGDVAMISVDRNQEPIPSTSKSFVSPRSPFDEPATAVVLPKQSYPASVRTSELLMPIKSHALPPKRPAPPASNSVKTCSACRMFMLNGGLMTSKGGRTRHFCNVKCLTRAEQSQPVPKVAALTKQCFTCKKAIVAGGLTAKRGDFVANFCNSVCLSRASSPSVAPQTIATGPRFAANTNGLGGPKFYCQVCDQPYAQKHSLKRHFVMTHAGHVFNNNIVAQNRTNQ